MNKIFAILFVLILLIGIFSFFPTEIIETHGLSSQSHSVVPLYLSIILTVIGLIGIITLILKKLKR